jgi:RNA polymerase sigma-70 factor (ECF subfamily)
VSGREGAADEVLVRRLYEEHGAALLAYATRLAGDRVLGEDVVRETLVRAWRDPGGTGRARLFEVARQVAAERRRTAGAADPLIDSMAVLDALDGLPPEHRDVLQALYFQGHGIAETAAALGVPEGVVKERGYQALTLLRRAVALPAAPPPVTVAGGAPG